MSQTNIILNETWNTLLNAMEQIFQLNNMARETYITLYNMVEKYFRSSEYNDMVSASLNKPKKANDSNKNVDQTDNDQTDINIPGGELYFNIKKFFKDYLEKIAENGNNLRGEDFLRFYAKTWERYQVSSQIANSILGFMNRNWITRQQKLGIKEIYEIYTMAMKIWQDIFFKESNHSLAQTCLYLINEEREGRRIDSLLIRQVVQSYVSAGFTKSNNNTGIAYTLSPSLTTYVEYFEKQFLQETIQFYQLESINYLENNSTNDYLKKVTQRLTEEEHRMKEYLHPTTLAVLIKKVEEVLIRDQLETIYGEAKALLRDEKYSDLALLFKLVSRVPNATLELKQIVEDHIRQMGTDSIEPVSGDAFNNPKLYVETILDIHSKFFKLLPDIFGCEEWFTAALDKVCGEFINNNAVTTAAGNTTKSAELLARYCDTVLRKENKAEESDAEEKINQIMVVFNYVEDKDVFQKFYGKMLAKRLVGQLSASDDYEELMISKLKAACGFEYASKLQRMFQDIRLSTSLNEEYKTDCENKHLANTVGFSAMVLSSNSWPFTAPPSFTLPTALHPPFENFTNFYSHKHSGRKLRWLYQQSKGELQTLYTKPKYTLQVSTYQMATLLLFNESESLTVEKMLDITQIESELFTQILLSFLKSRILTCSQINSDELTEDFKENEIKLNYTFQVDESFKSKKIKINLNQPIKSVEQKDSETVNQSIDEDRKMLVQAAIVRIMKTRNVLKYALLIQEVIPQLTSRFIPQIPMIKKCIDILIEKEYLERDPKERDLFRYLA